MTYRLFIDDERFPPNDGKTWVIARSSKEAMNIVYSKGMPSFISFDHDLGGDDTSMKFIDWMISITLDTENLFEFPRNYDIHSQNPVGVENIRGRMNSFIRYLDWLKENDYRSENKRGKTC